MSPPSYTFRVLELYNGKCRKWQELILLTENHFFTYRDIRFEKLERIVMIPQSIAKRLAMYSSIFNGASKNETVESRAAQNTANVLADLAIKAIGEGDRLKLQAIFTLTDFDDAQYDAMLVTAIEIDNADLFQDVLAKSGRKMTHPINKFWPEYTVSKLFSSDNIRQISNSSMLQLAILSKAENIAELLAIDPSAQVYENPIDVRVKNGCRENFKISGSKFISVSDEDEFSNHALALEKGMLRVATILAENLAQRTNALAVERAAMPRRG